MPNNFLALTRVSSVNGEKNAMMSHLIGAKACPHASDEAKKAANRVKSGVKVKVGEDADDGDDESSDAEGQPPKKKKRKLVTKVKQLSQKSLSFPKGIDVPFSDAEIAHIKIQFTRATISANLPYRWVVNPEVIKLFLMIRSCADDILPGDREISGWLLNNEHEKVEKRLKKVLHGQYAMIL